MTTEITTLNRLEDCACKEASKASRPCACVCPPPQIRTSCDAETGLLTTVNETYVLEDCQCVLVAKKWENETDCPVGAILSQRVGACELNEDTGDSFRLIEWVSGEREGCKCVKRPHKRHQLCGGFAE